MKKEPSSKHNDDKIICIHCGDYCKDETISNEDGVFCCTGCKFVYELLDGKEESGLYEELKKTGIKPGKVKKNEFSFLDDKSILEKFIQFKHEDRNKVVLYIPEIYCSACIYLLENINKLNEGILESKVNLLKKEISILYSDKITSLREIVELMTMLGYRPQLNLADLDTPRKNSYDKSLYIKLGIAGFCFGNIMLMALPEYLSGGNIQEDIKSYLSYFNLIFGIPLLYASSSYLISAWRGLKMKIISIDVPLAIGILALFFRSVYEILAGTGAGYMDSFAGLIFFLLLGRIFRQKTFHNLSFNRDFKSYFPLSVVKIEKGEEIYIPVKDLSKGDKIRIRNNEIIPADSILLSESATIDYSFVTGESTPVTINHNEKIYAGGKHIGGNIEVSVIKEFHQSYLTELWNNHNFKQTADTYTSRLSNRAAKYFTIVILIIASATLLYWIPRDMPTAINAFTAVLIIACPCAIALTIPFTYGTALRVFSRNNLFLKNDQIVEYLSDAKKIVFDKTGTLTYLNKNEISYTGTPLNDEELKMLKSATSNSTHPLSRAITQSIDIPNLPIPDSFNELAGKGIEAQFGNYIIKIGSQKFVKPIYAKTDNSESKKMEFSAESLVYVSINDEMKGVFGMKSAFRSNINETLKDLQKRAKIFILSGDNESEKGRLTDILGENVPMYFNQLPDEKLKILRNLKDKDSTVMMLGDGLNDAGALKEADLGIAITDDTANFSPGSDAILLADNLNLLPKFLKFADKAVETIYLSYIISLIYHTIGFFFAVQGLLSPLIAAILMPISSISVIILTVTKTEINARMRQL
jgi:P-type Cu+ transporter